ncbi:3-isopropylmalate dehydrogenase [Romboutsia ilealis]|uniref:3-isopropylmalate dehydrogenase n=1 Tax=Romboutsia faecis TaxID=2764597 RepID=A0ABR7JK88_9FIRM|nr:3-isopropylmalate dehydrogenase [Romboutsia faecis]MBC5995329.1 3-isopropylmalate dehydrogenase [Romboutsia faecis]MRN24426.1 3-isopropylmalate dehydrogenase [Romboutsia ilealis]
MNFKIALIKGDGIGPEISNETVKILNTIEKLYNHNFKIEEVIGAGDAVDKLGEPLPNESLKACVESDAVIVGNVGGSKWNTVELDKKPVRALLKIREVLNVSTNLRPITLNKDLMEFSPLKESIISKGIDILVVRDLVGSVICGEKKYSIGKNGREASDLEYYNEEIIKKSAKLAFSSAMKRRNKVSSIDKSNILSSSRLWKEVVNEESKYYPNVNLTHHLVDTAAMEVILNPDKFDVIVTSNMFGDILADELSQITGTACMLPSAEIDCNGKGLFTPNQLHHPDESIIGKDKANPIGLISSAALMLRYSFKLYEEANLIERAIYKVISQGFRTEDIYSDGNNLVGTSLMGDLICSCMCELFDKAYPVETVAI